MLENNHNITPEQMTDVSNVQVALTHLEEHFESIQIFATKVTANGETTTITLGVGNWNARKEMARMWVMGEDKADFKRRMG